MTIINDRFYASSMSAFNGMGKALSSAGIRPSNGNLTFADPGGTRKIDTE